jgi:hypothetical protein
MVSRELSLIFTVRSGFSIQISGFQYIINEFDFDLQLLRKEEHLRLGYSNEDFYEIKTHPFFASINWDLLVQKRIEPPWKPNVSDITDLKNIDPEFTQEPVSSSVVDTANGLNEMKDLTFSGFTYVPDSNLTKFLGQTE